MYGLLEKTPSKNPSLINYLPRNFIPCTNLLVLLACEFGLEVKFALKEIKI